ncbi:MAG: SDR family oxidoreductase [Bacteroidia bacterium]|nr:SDR family oxidoreductase [Bacteroidia bacterium]
MQLVNHTAVIFAATGAVSTGVARAFAAAGATLYLSGRDLGAVERLARELAATGAQVHTHQVDALDEAAVQAYAGTVLAQAGQVDSVFNGIGIRAAEGQYGTPAHLLPLEAFWLPLRQHVGSQFLTAKAFAPHFAARQRGAVVLLSASLGKDPAPAMAGIGAACGAIEALTRALAAEFALFGARVNCVNGGAMVETRTIQETTARNAAGMGMPPEAFLEMLRQRPITRRFPTVAEVANVAVYLASDYASALTGQVVNATAGLVLL